MYDCTRNYIDGEWVKSTAGVVSDIVNPATEKPIGTVSLGTAQEVDKAVAAARAAFAGYSQWTVDQRLDLLAKISSSSRLSSAAMAARIWASPEPAWARCEKAAGAPISAVIAAAMSFQRAL